MNCNCKVLKIRFEKLQEKHFALRRDHKKLLGLTVLLTDALEEFIKQGINDKIINTLESCYNLYPDVFEKSRLMEISSLVETPAKTNSVQILDECRIDYEPATESEREYYEGFLARPKIPRTPQQ